HHVYLDYPVNSPQAAINTAMQPLTFALTIVSALSLYSLFFTIYKSDYQWNAAGTALFLGLVSWLSAGLSGVVNATIAFDQIVHNSLWIVGHFHQMALLNIGFVAMAAVYAWLPDWTGHALYSESMAKWQIWLTFVFGTANSAVWLVEGLQGAPRRFAVLPGQFLTLSQVGAGFAIVLGAAQILFFWNIVQTIRGKVAKPASERGGFGVALAKLVFVVLLGLLAFAAGAAIWIVAGNVSKSQTTTTAAKPATTATTTTPSTTTTPANLGGGDPVAGKAVFESAGCKGCHTLAAAGATGTVGPNLDQKKPPLALVLLRVTQGKGAMPSFKSTLTPQQIKDVAAFVVQSTSG
ncbi:MAG TPA: cbb3-type cytochrome c oxidase subunit I, partial [Gaiellaceae bacterium]|nr:cbb3-type cytochrome c oxidase subunit I [Gaiellaceae bacterium]